MRKTYASATVKLLQSLLLAFLKTPQGYHGKPGAFIPSAFFSRLRVAGLHSFCLLISFFLLAQISFAQSNPDIPDFARFKVDKQAFMERRAEAIGFKRGVEKDKPFDPTKRIAAVGQMEAQKSAILSRQRTQRTTSLLAAWTEIGPNPIPNGQTVTGPQLAVSGRTISIAIHPTNPNIVYVGTAQGGLYRSLNGGATWVPLLDNGLSLAINTIAIAPSQTSTIFVGTGEANFSQDSYFGVGIYRIDNAESASPIISAPIGGTTFQGRAVSKIVVHPTDPNIIFAGSASGIGGIGGAGPSVGANRGIFRSTNALSASPTFTQLTITGIAAQTRNVVDIVMDPGNPDLVLLTIGDSFNAGEGGVYRSTNALSATPSFVRTFTAGVGTTASRTELALNRTAGVVTVYAASGFLGGTVQRSVDGGATWTQTIDNNFCTPQCFYDIAIAVDPVDATRVYLGGSPTLVFGVSANSGVSFTDNATTAQGLHADSHVIGVAPSNPSIIYFGSDGGIYKSTTSGTTWTSLNNATFRATQFMSLAMHPTDPNFTIGGTQDNGTNFYRPDASWFRADFGDGGYAAIDQNATDNTNVRMYHTYFNQTNAMGYARVTTTASATEGSWTLFGCGFGGSTANGMTCTASAILFYAPLETGPGNPNTLYFGSDVLYRSSNGGTNVTKVSQEPITSGVAISAIGISPQNDNVRVVGQNNGGIWGTTTGASPLINLDPTNTVPNNFVARVVIDPNDVNTAYVTLSAFGVTSIWKTINLNAATPTWTAAATGVPQVPVNAFVVDPANSNNLYAGTDIGVYASDDGGATWNPFGTGLPVVAVFDMGIHPVTNVLRIATHGRGMWQIPLTVVNNAPVVTTSAGTTAFAEGNNVTSTPVVVDGALTVTDDGATLASGTVSITTGFQTTEDVLAFTNNGSTMGNIAGSYDIPTGVLTLTSAGATATVAQWQNALRSVSYTNNSNTPNTANRIVSFQVNDGTNNSNIATKTISVAAVNDDPIITSNGGGINAAISVAENTTAVTTVIATDADGTTPTYTLNGGADASKFMLNPTTGALAFIAAPDFENPTDANTDNQYIVVVRASDGTANDDQTITVTVTDLSEGLIITNASPSALIDFSSATPSSAGTNPQTAFTGVGFSPDPTTAGRLNSNAWATTGWSDGALPFGGTNTAGDHARGSIAAAVTTGGMYSYTGAPGSVANPTLMIQPGGGDFAPGTLTLKIQNKGTDNITQLTLSYNLYVRNDQARSNSFNFSHSADNAAYTSVAALNYTSPEVADALGWVLIGSAPSRSTTITGLNILPGAVYYIRWSGVDVGGTGSRDEFGLDDINVAATYSSAVLPTLSVNNVSANEGNTGTSTFSFTVSLSAPAPAGGVTFDIATANNTATIANNDYVAKSLTGQTIPAGNTTYTFDVTVNGDVAVEPNESFFVNVTNVTNATVSDGQGEGTIVNDDAAAPVTLSINNVSANETNSGTTTFSFTVSLSAPAPSGGVTFDIATADNTATIANSDYVAKSLTSQTIPVGNTTYTFDVTVNGDAAVEPNESFLVNVTNVTNATVVDGQGEGTIVNDDVVVGVTTYYPRTTATDLSQASNWTDAPSGIGGASPANFSSANQLFNLNNNVANPVVNGSLGLSGGSNLVLNNTNPLVFTTAANFSLGSGSSADFNSKPVTLKSTASGTAFIGVIGGSLTNASNVTVERYLSSNNNRAYRLLTPSVNTATNIRTNWQEGGSNVAGLGTHITGSTTGANGFDITQTGQGSLFTYNPIIPAWEYINNTDVNSLDAKKGYLLYIRGDRTIDLNSTASPLPSTNTTLRATGTLLTGAQSFTGTTGNNGFNLVSNPYAAAINWSAVYGASTNLTQFYTLWDPNVGTQGGYVTVNTTGIKSNATSNATTSIQSGQAYFVQASGVPAPVVNLLETHKSPANNIDVFRMGSQTEMFSTSLFFNDANSNRINADGVNSVYNNSYSTAVDGDDATQLANWDEDVAIARSNSSLSIESRPLIDVHDTIHLTMARMQVRNYEWQFNSSNFNHPNLSASLRDNFTGTITPINLIGQTVVPFAVTGNSASSAVNRFMVVFGPNTALPVSMSDVKAFQKEKNIQVEWTAQTEVNLDKYEVEESTDARQFLKATTVTARGTTTAITYNWLDVNVSNGSNYYRIKAIGKTGEAQYSKVVRVNMGKTENEITVYPNPIKENVFSLSVNLPKGKYTITLTNKLGQQVYKKQITHAGGASTQSLQLNINLAQGSYQLTVSDGKNNYVKQIVKE